MSQNNPNHNPKSNQTSNLVYLSKEINKSCETARNKLKDFIINNRTINEEDIIGYVNKIIENQKKDTSMSHSSLKNDIFNKFQELNTLICQLQKEIDLALHNLSKEEGTIENLKDPLIKYMDAFNNPGNLFLLIVANFKKMVDDDSVPSFNLLSTFKMELEEFKKCFKKYGGAGNRTGNELGPVQEHVPGNGPEPENKTEPEPETVNRNGAVSGTEPRNLNETGPGPGTKAEPENETGNGNRPGPGNVNETVSGTEPRNLNETGPGPGTKAESKNETVNVNRPGTEPKPEQKREIILILKINLELDLKIN